MIKRLVAIGAAYIDTILDVPKYPEEDSKLRATSISRRRGGNCANSLEVLQQLLHHQAHLDLGPGPEEYPTKPNTQHYDLELFLISVLPSDQCEATTFIKDSFNQDPEIQNKVNLQHCIYRQNTHEAASSYAIVSQSTGSRTLVNYSDLQEMSFDELKQALENINAENGPADTWYHFEGRNIDVARQCISYLRNSTRSTQPTTEVVVSVEIEKPGREGLGDLALLADVAFFSKSWAKHNGCLSSNGCVDFYARRCFDQPCAHEHIQKAEDGRTSVPVDLLKSRRDLKQWKWVFCTWGEKGSAGGYYRAWGKDDGRTQPTEKHGHCRARHLTPSWFVDGCFQQHHPVLDTVGAGDTWNAAMVFLLLRGHVRIYDSPSELGCLIDQNLDFANILAGIKVTMRGFTGLGRAMAERGPLLYSRYGD